MEVSVQDAGLKVPEDISIITFDDTYISEIVRPAFTCIACDYKQLADCLVGTAVDAAEGEDAEQQQVVKMEMKERLSCRKIGNKK